MEDLNVPEYPGICLVADDSELIKEVCSACPTGCRIESMPLSGLLDLGGNITPHLRQIEEASASLDVVLIQWHMQQAPSIGALAYRIRTVPAPLLALVGNDPNESIAALMVGVDSIHPRPISFPLLRAQIFAHLRTLNTSVRTGPVRTGAMAVSEERAGRHPDERRLEIGSLSLDPRQYRFFIKGESVKLTPRQFELVKFLMERRDQLVTRDEILQAVWQIEFDTATNLVDVYIHFLRRLLRAHSTTASIETIRGKGYRFSIPEEGPSSNALAGM